MASGFIRPRIWQAFVAATLAAACASAQADVVTIADIAAGGDPNDSTFPLGTFSFQAPLGPVTSASVSLVNYDVYFSNTAAFYLDGVLLGTLGFGNGQSVTFSLTDTSVLDDGSAVLTWSPSDYASGAEKVLPNGGAELVIHSADVAQSTVPEPMTLALVLAGLGAAGLVRRTRGGSAAGPRNAV